MVEWQLLVRWIDLDDQGLSEPEPVRIYGLGLCFCLSGRCDFTRTKIVKVK
jgi:hypothetical protein